MAINDGRNDKIYSQHHIANTSFDGEFQVQVTELLAYDPLVLNDLDQVVGGLKRVTADALAMYRVNDITDDSLEVYYIGREDADGDWYITQVNQANNARSFRYASAKNNTSYTDYTTAWAAYGSLTYGTYSQAF